MLSNLSMFMGSNLQQPEPTIINDSQSETEMRADIEAKCEAKYTAEIKALRRHTL